MIDKMYMYNVLSFNTGRLTSCIVEHGMSNTKVNFLVNVWFGCWLNINLPFKWKQLFYFLVDEDKFTLHYHLSYSCVISLMTSIQWLTISVIVGSLMTSIQ